MDDLSDRIVADATCGGCGCACDDIEVTARAGRIVAARHACELGEAWFGQDSAAAEPVCQIAGKPAELADGVKRAAELLAAARYPLVYGLEQTSSEAARLAVGVADWIGAVVDTTSGAKRGLGGLSLHGIGEVTCSLGEIRNRADVIVVWRADPVVTHPRHFSRYSLEPVGRFVPGGRRDRTCVVVDTRRTATVEHADQFLQLRTGSDFEALWIMRSLVRGLPLDAERVLVDTGVSLAEWQALGEKLKNARFAVVLFDGQLSDGPAGHLQVDALWALVRDLNAHTRAAAAPLVPHGNSAGAAGAICARAAATSAVDFARGYPRFNHDEYSADRVLARGEVDAALVVGVDSLDGLSSAARKRLSAIPRVTFATHPQIAKGASVAFVTAPYGRASGGTIIRTDGVPLPLRPALAMSRPSDVDVLVRLEARVKQLCAARNAAIAEHARAAT